MDEVQLDIVSSDATLPDCLDLMKRAKRRAVVVEHDRELTLITAEAITKAMNRAVDQKLDPAQVTVGTVRPPSSSRWHLAPDFLATVMKVPAHLRLDTSARSQFRLMFDEQDSRHALIRMPDQVQPKARVITSSERFAQSLGSSVTICRCAGPSPEVHTFTRDQVEEEGVCNYPHRASLTCDEI
jgi:hypothetical protein